jgi:hypothetical protein
VATEQSRDTEIAYANPRVVEKLVKAIAFGLEAAIIPGETTQSDMLSAVFTVLYRMIDASNKEASDIERQKNSVEIGRVLKDMLFTFGTSSVQ